MTALSPIHNTPSGVRRIVNQLDGLISNAAPVIGRLLIGGMFAHAGFAKIGAFAGTQAYMQSVGLPGALLPLVIGLEILAGVALILGWQTRIAATLLAGFTALTALTFHNNLADQMQFLLFMKNFAITGGLLVLAGLGAGRFALDNRRV